MVNHESIKVDPAKIEAVLNWGRSKKPTDVKSSWVQPDIIEGLPKKIVKIATPLTKLTRKAEKFNWD